MDLFGSHWADHLARLEQSWRETVRPEDTVVVAGDTDWGLHLEEAMETLLRIDSWPGRKLLIRGNHDYWWSSKTTNRVRKALPPSLILLHNNAIQAEGFNICGSKGSPVPGSIEWTAQNMKLLNREQQRLLLSLDSRDLDLPTIVGLHYPPFYPSQGPSPYSRICEQHGVVACVYGHLHGDAASSGPIGRYDGVQYYCVAADAVDFRPILIETEGLLGEPPVPKRRGMQVSEEQRHPDDIGELAERAMADKRDEMGSEEQARELYDVPTESPRDLEEQQERR